MYFLKWLFLGCFHHEFNFSEKINAYSAIIYVESKVFYIIFNKSNSVGHFRVIGPYQMHCSKDISLSKKTGNKAIFLHFCSLLRTSI